MDNLEQSTLPLLLRYARTGERDLVNYYSYDPELEINIITNLDGSVFPAVEGPDAGRPSLHSLLMVKTERAQVMTILVLAVTSDLAADLVVMELRRRAIPYQRLNIDDFPFNLEIIYDPRKPSAMFITGTRQLTRSYSAWVAGDA